MKSSKGFTMVELMVVVLIVGILAAVAVPLMSGRIDSSKWSEAKAAMGTIASSMRSYAAEKGSFASAPSLDRARNHQQRPRRHLLLSRSLYDHVRFRQRRPGVVRHHLHGGQFHPQRQARQSHRDDPDGQRGEQLRGHLCRQRQLIETVTGVHSPAG